MTHAPIAQTIHPGGLPDDGQRQLLFTWLAANRINPSLVSTDEPVLVLPVPLQSNDPGGPWMVQVIVFSQMYAGETGAKETNLITGRPVAFQRTVPLIVPFPTEATTGGEDHGQTDQQAAQEAPEEQVRDARQEGVPDRHQGQGPQRAGKSGPARHEGTAEEGPGRGDEAVSEPEEDCAEEEVGAR